MPHKDPELKRAYARAWYAKHREAVMRKHKEYRDTRCVGVCQNCGGPTRGDRPNRIPTHCRKPECARAQRLGIYVKKGESYDNHRRDGADD